MTLVIAHRGASADAPENTLEAFELAVSQGADMIETDLHLSADGAIPLWHDPVIEGAPIEGLRFAEIRARKPTVPTLEETLGRFGTRIPFNLEIKASASGEYAGLESRVLEIVRDLAALDQVLFSSFELGPLRRIRELEPKARIAVLLSSRTLWVKRLEDRARALSAEAVNPSVRRMDRRLVVRLHALGFHVHVYTVDEPEMQHRLLEWGVDGIFTNRPAALRQLLSSRDAQ